jgi:hypothetical protein
MNQIGYLVDNVGFKNIDMDVSRRHKRKNKVQRGLPPLYVADYLTVAGFLAAGAFLVLATGFFFTSAPSTSFMASSAGIP